MECHAPRVCPSQQVNSACASARYAHQDQSFGQDVCYFSCSVITANLFPIRSYANGCFDVSHVSAKIEEVESRKSRFSRKNSKRVSRTLLCIALVKVWFGIYLVTPTISSISAEPQGDIFIFGSVSATATTVDEQNTVLSQPQRTESITPSNSQQRSKQRWQRSSRRHLSSPYLKQYPKRYPQRHPQRRPKQQW